MMSFSNIKHIKEIPDKKDFFYIFKSIDLKDRDFNPDNYVPGTSSETKLFNEFISKFKVVIKN